MKFFKVPVMSGIVHIEAVQPEEEKMKVKFVFPHLGWQQGLYISCVPSIGLKAGVQAEEEQMLEYVGLVNTLLLQTRK